MSAADSAPSWLSDLRANALLEYGNTPAPSDEEEVWRYSRIADVELGGFTPAASAGRHELGATPDGIQWFISPSLPSSSNAKRPQRQLPETATDQLGSS